VLFRSRAGNLVFTAGQLPGREGKLVATGKVPTDVSLEAAQKAAQVAVLNALAAVVGVAGSLDCVRRIVRLNCFVNSAAGFTDQAKVANGASELLTAIFGEAGKHSRCAIGAAELPLNAPLELDLVVEIA
jgi:enamine deaminase RidA (YjgF/YER057c/UK114 family)